MLQGRFEDLDAPGKADVACTGFREKWKTPAGFLRNDWEQAFGGVPENSWKGSFAMQVAGLLELQALEFHLAFLFVASFPPANGVSWKAY